MPKLIPIPIPTKNENIFKALFYWIFKIRKWKIIEDWQFVYDNKTIVIPKNFIFDGASIPRIFWLFLSPVGLLLIPGLIHDFGYKYNMFWVLDHQKNKIIPSHDYTKRYMWDFLFRNVAIFVNGFKFINSIAWFALFLGGWWAWCRHRKHNYFPLRPSLKFRKSL